MTCDPLSVERETCDELPVSEEKNYEFLLIWLGFHIDLFIA